MAATLSVPPLGSEFMPPLNEGTILFMPTAVPGMSINEATRILQIQDRMLRQIPEVEPSLARPARPRRRRIPRRSRCSRPSSRSSRRANGAGHDLGKIIAR
jgi:hypothetical protein